MRIVVDARETKNINGTSRYIYNLVRALRELTDDQLFALFDEEPVADFDIRPFVDAWVTKPWKRPLWEQLWLPWMLKHLGADLYHATANRGIPLYCSCASVLTIHDVIPFSFPMKEWSLAKLGWYRWTVSTSARSARHVLTDSRFSMQEIQQRLGVPSNKIRSIHLAAKSEFRPLSEKETTPIIESYGLEWKRYVLCLGGLTPRKNASDALRAYASLSADIKSKYKIVITGKHNNYLNELEKLAMELNLENVYFPGLVPDDDLVAVLAGAVLSVFPSLYEGFGLPVLESMAVGVPAIAYRATSIPEIAGKAALLVPVGDVVELGNAMSQVLQDNLLQRMLAMEGLQQSKLFSWEKTARETLQVYQSIAR